MNKQEFCTEMQRWVIDWKGSLTRMDRIEIGHGIFSKYLADKNEISRDLLARFGEYSKLVFMTASETITEIKLKELEKKQNQIEKIQRKDMLFLRRTARDFEPLIIRVEKKLPNELEAFSQGIYTENDKYLLFKIWFFKNAVGKYSERGEEIFFVDRMLWQKVCVAVPKFVEQLLKEGEAYYEEKGYFQLKNDIKQIEVDAQRRINRMSDEQQRRVLFVRCDGKIVKVVD